MLHLHLVVLISIQRNYYYIKLLWLMMFIYSLFTGGADEGYQTAEVHRKFPYKHSILMSGKAPGVLSPFFSLPKEVQDH